MDTRGPEEIKGKPGTTAYTQIIENLKKGYTTKPDPKLADQPKPGDLEKMSEILGELIVYPYDWASKSSGYPGFKLDPTEKKIDTWLSSLVITYYLPNIDIGKWSLILLIIFNVGMVGLKLAEYKAYRDKIDKKPETVPKEDIKKTNQPATTVDNFGIIDNTNLDMPGPDKISIKPVSDERG